MESGGEGFSRDGEESGDGSVMTARRGRSVFVVVIGGSDGDDASARRLEAVAVVVASVEGSAAGKPQESWPLEGIPGTGLPLP